MADERAQRPDLRTVALEIFEISKLTWLMAQRRKPEGEYDLSESEFLALDVLQHQGPMTVGDLQRRVEVLPAQMSRIIRNLETKFDQPLVDCAINADDKRKINVKINRLGAQAADGFRQSKIELTIESLRVLSDEDLVQLLRIVRQTRAAAENLPNQKEQEQP